MIYAALKTVHVLPIIVWIGGMVFAHFFLRPAVAASEWAAGGVALAQIRTSVSINLGLGVLVLLVTLMRWTV